MSSFYDDASLVVIPSGYKTSKVYAEKPTDGSGDLTFTRTGDTATRVNSAGLIEKVRTNINTYSEQLDNAAWTKQSTTVTANATTAPNNTLTADKLIATATTAFHGIFNVNATLSSLHTFSFYAKKAEYNFVTALDQFSGTFLASFNLDTGVVSSGSGASIQSVGNGWYRCAISFDGAASAVVATLAPSPSSASVNYLGDGTSGIFVWGVQLETGDIATDYIPTTTAAVSVGPVANVPRLDYLGSSCPRLLLEPQRTNLLTFSESFGSAGSLADAVVTSNSITSPDGYANADSFLDNSANGIHAKLITISKAASPVTYTYSLFIKAKDAGMKFLASMDDAAIGGGDSGIFDPSTGTFVTAMGTPSAGYTNPSRSVTNYGNGWYRISFTMTTASVTSNRFNAFLVNAANAVSYIGTGTGIYVYGAQAEEGAYATSYIPTLAASATRGADAASKTGISSLIGQTEGTLFGEFTFTGVTSLHMLASVAGSYTSAVYVQTGSSTGISMQVWSGATNQVGINFIGLTVGQNVKFAAAYKANDFMLYVNGVQAGSSTSGSVPAGLSQLEVGSYAEAGSPFNFNSSIKQAIVFKTRLTNAELATLTTL
jgi:hypothetical protein